LIIEVEKGKHYGIGQVSMTYEELIFTIQIILIVLFNSS